MKGTRTFARSLRPGMPAAGLAILPLFLALEAGCARPAAVAPAAGGGAPARAAEEWVRLGLETPALARARASRPAEEILGGGGQEADLEDLENLEDLEAPDEEAPAPRQPRRSRRASPRPAAGPGPETGKLLEELRASRSARRDEAGELLRQARASRDLGDLIRAEGLVERALLLAPQDEEAQRLLDEIRLLLGDTRGVVASTAQEIKNRHEVAVQQARTEIQRGVREARLRVEEGDYERAMELYKRAIEGIRYSPFDLNLDPLLKEAEGGLARAERLKEERDEREAQERARMIEEQKRRELAENLSYVDNQIRELRRRAAAAMQNKDYERAVSLYDQILALNPHDDAAQTARAQARSLGHRYRFDRRLRESVDNYELAILGVEESSVIYQRIFRYPEREVWERLSPRVVSIEEQAEAEEPAGNKDLRRRLEVPYSFTVPEETPLGAVLQELQNLTGVNFFVQGGETGAGVGETPVKLPPLNNLPLKNILNHIIRQAGEDYGYVIKEGAVVIGPRGDLQEPRYLRFYEISDLIQSRPDFKAPKVALDELMGRATAAAEIDLGGEEEAVGGAVLESDKLEELISKALAAAEGEEVEGIRIHGGKLSALTTLDKHLKIAKILDRFRRQTGMMVTVESRFLDIQDNFLEEIGVNIGSSGTTNLPNTIPDIDGAGTALSPGYEFIDAKGDFNLRAATIGGFSNPLGSQVNPFNLSSTGGGAYQLNVLDAERFQLEAILTGVAKEQRIRRLNSPRVTAFNTQTSHSLVVQQAAYIQDLEVNQTGVIPVINPVIGVINTGSILEVRPTISYDRKYVVLELQPTLAEQIGQEQSILNLSQGFTVVPVQLPIVSVTKIKTTVTIPDGGTVLVGGLKREIRQEQSIGIPVLRNIPLLNLLFGRKGEAAMRSNLFVLINARITIVHEEEERLFGSAGA